MPYTSLLDPILEIQQGENIKNVFDMEEYRQAFVKEAKEHFKTLTQALLVLEKDLKNTDSFNNIFRSAHTIKGSSKMIGFKDLQDLVHALEDIFDGSRKGDQVSSDMIDLILECIVR